MKFSATPGLTTGAAIDDIAATDHFALDVLTIVEWLASATIDAEATEALGPTSATKVTSRMPKTLCRLFIDTAYEFVSVLSRCNSSRVHVRLALRS